MKKYKEHKNKYNMASRMMFNKKLTDIIESNDLSDKEKKIKHDYFKYMPVKRNKCTMNSLCYYIEDIVFDNCWKNKNRDFDYSILMSSPSVDTSSQIFKNILSELKEFLKGYKNIAIFENNFESYLEDEYEYEPMYNHMYEELENNLFSICSNKLELCDYVIFIVYNKFKTCNKDFLWRIFGDQIAENLKNKTDKFSYVIESDDGKEYLGKKYKVVEVKFDEVIQKN